MELLSFCCLRRHVLAVILITHELLHVAVGKANCGRTGLLPSRQSRRRPRATRHDAAAPVNDALAAGRCPRRSMRP